MNEILKMAEDLLGPADFEAFSGELWLRLEAVEAKIAAGAPVEAVILAEFKRYAIAERNPANRAQNRPHRRVRVTEKLDQLSIKWGARKC
jgi:hypothetical protein